MATLITVVFSNPPSPPDPENKATFAANADACVTHFTTLYNELTEFKGELNTVVGEINSTIASIEDIQAQVDAVSDSAATASAAASNANLYMEVSIANATSASNANISALSASNDSESARDVAVSAKDTAVAAMATSESFSLTASNAAIAAVSSAIICQDSETTAVAAKDVAVSAKNDAEVAASEALAAKVAALEAKVEALAAMAAASLSASNAAFSEQSAAGYASNAALSAAAAGEIALGSIPNATEEQAGKIALSTILMMEEATDDNTAVTPYKSGITFAYKQHTHAASNVGLSNVTNDAQVKRSEMGVALGVATLNESGLLEQALSTMPTAAQVGALALSGGSLTGSVNFQDNTVQRPHIQDWSEVCIAKGTITSTTVLDLTTGNVFSATLGAALTFTFSNPPASGRAGGFVLHITNGGAYTITWPTSVKWAGGTAPTLTAAGLDILVFQTLDGGTTWSGGLSRKDVK